MARAALGWSIRETADRVQIGVNTLSRFEGRGKASIKIADALRKAYEATGVQFLAEGATSITGGVGVRIVQRIIAHG